MIDTSCKSAVGDFSAEIPQAKTSAPTQRTPQKFGSEAELEAAISAAMARMCDAPTREEKLREWREMCALIDQRTPARVRFMERTRGIA